MHSRYTDLEMADIWSEENKFKTWHSRIKRSFKYLQMKDQCS